VLHYCEALLHYYTEHQIQSGLVNVLARIPCTVVRHRSSSEAEMSFPFYRRNRVRWRMAGVAKGRLERRETAAKVITLGHAVVTM
jgi:hypothetical protein